jgi:hypothetical protein
MAKKIDSDEMMVCIGPAERIRNDFRKAMAQIEFALKTLAPQKNRAMRCARNDIDVARELLLPILNAIDGKGPGPPRVPRPKLTPEDEKFFDALTKVVLERSRGEGSEPGESTH